VSLCSLHRLSGTFLIQRRTERVMIKFFICLYVKSSPITGLDRHIGFQEIKTPRFRDNGTGS